MASLFFYIFFSLSQPISNIKLTIGTNPDAHGHDIGAHSSHGPEGTHHTELQITAESSDVESNGNQEGKEGIKAGFTFDESVLAQMVGVGILEFGVLLHRCGKFILWLDDD